MPWGLDGVSRPVIVEHAVGTRRRFQAVRVEHAVGTGRRFQARQCVAPIGIIVDNMSMGLRRTGWAAMDWRALLGPIMNFWVPYNLG
jgi:hypothetical protein